MGIFAKIGLVSAAALATAGAAQATIYNAVTGFGTAPWSYGKGDVGAGFSSLTFESNCSLYAGLSCYAGGGDYDFPAVAQNVSSQAVLIFYTNVLPKTELFMQSLVGNKAIVRFTAPNAGFYHFTGAFERLDNSDGSGDGTFVGVSGLTATAIPKVFHSSVGIDVSRQLAVNQTIDFFVDSGAGNTYNDGTGLSLIASVPEPATWAMMVGGFGLVGGALRRRQRSAARFA